MAVFLGILFGVIGSLIVYITESSLLFTIIVGGMLGYLLGRLSNLKFNIARLQYQIEKLTATATSEPSQVTAQKSLQSQDEHKTFTPHTTPDTTGAETMPSKPAAPAPAASAPQVQQPASDPQPQKEQAHEKPAGAEADNLAVGRPAAAARKPEAAPPARQQAASGEANASHDTPWAEQQATALAEQVGKFFSGENALLRIGIIILFIGVGFLIKYAVEENLFPVSLRLALVGAGALVLLGTGWKLRNKRHDYAMGLQGAGVGILYLDIIGTLKFTSILPPTAAFVLLFLVCAFSAILAILQNSRILAAMGAIGGYLAPLLTSTGSGAYQPLFSYYLLLNTGILAIAWFKSWRSLNMIGFVFTFSVGLLWGVREYRPEMFWPIEFFLLAFFLQFVLIAILFALRQPQHNKGYVDGSLVFGTPLLTFGVQAVITRPYEFGLAFTALGFAVFYLLISILFARTKRGYYRLFGEATLGLGIVFGTLAVPMALDGRWTSAAWALEGAAILWIGIRQHRLLPRIFGVLLQFLSGGAFLLHFTPGLDLGSLFEAGQATNLPAPLPVFNSLYLGGLLITVAGMLTALLLHRNRQAIHSQEYSVYPLLIVWSLAWWFGAGLVELLRYLPAPYTDHTGLLMLFVVVSSGLFYSFARITRLAALERTVYLVPLTMLVMLGYLLLQSLFSVMSSKPGLAHPLAHSGYLGWAGSLLLFYLLFYLREKQRPEWRPTTLHAVISLTVFFVIVLETSWHTVHWLSQAAAWSKQTWMLVTMGLLGTAFLSLSIQLSQRLAWPCGRHLRAYLYNAPGCIGLLLLLWLLVSTFLSDADPAPIRYIPLLNPLELTQAFVLLTIAWWLIALKRHQLHDPYTTRLFSSPVTIGLALFTWINSMIVRTLGHWGGIDFELEAMVTSALAQATFSILWTLLALLTMFLATRRHYRQVWFGGFALLVVVIVKLVLIDLSNSGTLWRIASFIGVGVLLLVISYLAPLPPRMPKEENQ